jgi:hypothetical protein
MKYTDVQLHSFDDLDNFIASRLNRRYILGMNYLTGNSRMVSFVDIAAELAIGVYLFLFLLNKEPISKIPAYEIGLIYMIKYVLKFLDSLFLVITRVLFFLDVLSFVLDGLFWACFTMYFKEKAGNKDLWMDRLWMLALIRLVFVPLYYLISTILLGRDNPVSKWFNFRILM